MKISQINVYPVKSMKGNGLTEATVEKRGIRHDRRWMLTDLSGKFLTQREFPRLALIGVRIHPDSIEFSAPDQQNLRIPLAPAGGQRQDVEIWQNVCKAEVYPSEVNRWFGGFLETDCQLVYMPDTTERHVNERFDSGNDIVSFADGYPLLILSEASLADLNSRLVAPLPMERFRPNLVVSGADAFAEDRWKRVKIGDAVFRVAKPCARCVITTIDQTAARFDGKEPLKTLAPFREARMIYPDTYESLGLAPNYLLFGQNLIPENPEAKVRVGDAVNVLE